jgi:two-component system sensor histidine kinase CpxA
LPPDARPPLNEPVGIAQGRGRGRFFISDGGYWIGLRVPFHSGEYEGRVPATLLIHPRSSWGLLRLLDVQPWLLAGAAVIAFSILFWIPIVRSITRSLGQLTVATGKIADGEFQTRVSAARRDEIGRLGDSVNQMAGRLDTLVNGQRRFLADIAHELGSPIGRLQVAVEILESRAADPTLQAQVADVREEVQQMSALVNELLTFTKAGLRPRPAELAPVELAPLVAQAVAREGGTARISTDVPAGLAARADGPLLTRAVANLVRNAIRYSGDSTPIKVTAHEGGGRVMVTVADEGPGVPPEALARLGEPFYRPEAARTRETGGTGLGLAIVRSAVAACGGEVRFANLAPHGFSAEIALSAG